MRNSRCAAGCFCCRMRRAGRSLVSVFMWRRVVLIGRHLLPCWRLASTTGISRGSGERCCWFKIVFSLGWWSGLWQSGSTLHVRLVSSDRICVRRRSVWVLLCCRDTALKSPVWQYGGDSDVWGLIYEIAVLRRRQEINSRCNDVISDCSVLYVGYDQVDNRSSVTALFVPVLYEAWWVVTW